MKNNRSGLKNNAPLVLNGAPIESSEHFDVFVGRVPDEVVDQYIILNRKYGVIEFACANEYMWREWLLQMESRMREQSTPPPSADVVQLFQ